MAKASQQRPNPARSAKAAKSSVTAASPMGQKRVASGSVISDFNPLFEAEKEIIACCAAGRRAMISAARPRVATAANRVKAEFIRFLALGGDSSTPVHETGLRINGAFVEGDLELRGSSISLPLTFNNCAFDNIDISNCVLNNLIMNNVSVKALSAEDCRIAGSLCFRRSSFCYGGFRLASGYVGGVLDLSGSRFFNRFGDAISCDRMVVKKSAFLDRGFRALGTVRLRGASIGGVLSFRRALIIAKSDESVSPEDVDAIVADGVVVGGDLYFSDGFAARGSVRVPGADIEGDLICAQAVFSHPHGVAFSARNARVGEAFFWRQLERVDGEVSVDSVEVTDLIDDLSSWEMADQLDLDGFSYGRIASGATDAETRIRWLKRHQRYEQRGKFWPQPWEHLIKILREMGHAEDAKIVAIEKQKEIRKRGLVGVRLPRQGLGGVRGLLDRMWTPVSNGIEWVLHVIYGALAGYGYRPLRTVVWMLGFWAVAALSFAVAAHDGMFAPTNIRLYTDSRFAACGDGRAAGRQPWTECTAMPPEYTVFNPAIYSLDLILPVVDMGQERDWTPITRSSSGPDLRLGLALRILIWVEILFGWLTSLLLVSALGRLIQKD